jgi:predicted Zn-dependent peptidase
MPIDIPAHLPSAAPPLHTLANGLRLIVLPLPRAATVTAAVFLHGGSQLESAAASGIGHAIEHMVFKGTAQRDARRLNLDVERLGAEVNAHTDKDHTAFHLHGLPRHLPRFLELLAELVRSPSFPAAELEREREVLLHEFAEDEDDPLSTAFKLLDKACWGAHPLARPVIGTRRNLQRFKRDDLLDWVRRHYRAARCVVAVAGPVRPDDVLRLTQAAFGDRDAQADAPPLASLLAPTLAPPLTSPLAPLLAPPAWLGGVAAKRQDGSSQVHLALAFPIASRRGNGDGDPHDDGDARAAVAAAVLGEGMSSPLLDQLREQRGLAYYTACSADVLELAGQFVVELSTAPAQLDEALRALAPLLRQQADGVAAIDMERAHNQLAVRQLRALERPLRRLEDAALEVFALGRIRSPRESLERLLAVDARAAAAEFARMLQAGAALALAGSLPRAASERAREALPGLLRAADH